MDALVSSALMIRLSLQPSPASETSAFNNIREYPRLQQALGRALAFSYQRFELLAFLNAQPHNILLYRNLLRSHDCLRRMPSDQSESQIRILAN
jgi:hypothetical protein